MGSGDSPRGSPQWGAVDNTHEPDEYGVASAAPSEVSVR
jgi:hypothetical protein